MTRFSYIVCVQRQLGKLSISAKSTKSASALLARCLRSTAAWRCCFSRRSSGHRGPASSQSSARSPLRPRPSVRWAASQCTTSIFECLVHDGIDAARLTSQATAAEHISCLLTGATSVALLVQVYKGRLKTGEQVAVKVQRPNVVETVSVDLFIIRCVPAHVHY